jgi:hypothetical protein
MSKLDLLLILTISQFLLVIILNFWIVNKDCQECKETLPPSRVFTFKSKCAYCERSGDE